METRICPIPGCNTKFFRGNINDGADGWAYLNYHIENEWRIHTPEQIAAYKASLEEPVVEPPVVIPPVEEPPIVESLEFAVVTITGGDYEKLKMIQPMVGKVIGVIVRL